MIKVIRKENSQTFGKISANGLGGFFACVMQGEGFEQVFFGGKTFGTMKGAERWVSKELAR